MPKKINTKPIKYTSRDFDSIKEDLVDYAKRYYPNTFKDFNEWIAGYNSYIANAYADASKDQDKETVNEFVDVEAA